MKAVMVSAFSSLRPPMAGVAALVLVALLSACMGGRTALFEDEAKPEWQEGALELPPLPFEKDLIPFHVSSNASAAFYVDGRSLRLGDDRIDIERRAGI